MPEKFGEMNIENCVLTSSNGEIFDWSGIKDITTEIENEDTGNDKERILFNNNLEYTFEFESGPGFRKVLDRLQFGWKASGPIRKKLLWRLIKKYKFDYYIL